MTARDGDQGDRGKSRERGWSGLQRVRQMDTVQYEKKTKREREAVTVRLC